MGYRFPRTIDRTRVELDNGELVAVELRLDGSTTGGIQCEYLLPAFKRMSYLGFYFNVGGAKEAVSIRTQGLSITYFERGYLLLDLGFKPMFRLAGDGPTLFVSPVLGFASLVSNLQRTPSSDNSSYATTSDDSSALVYGANLDLMDRGSIGAELSVRCMRGAYFLKDEMISAWEVRLGLNYLSRD